MMIRIKTILALTLFFLAAIGITAQTTGAMAVLVYADDETAVQVTDAAGAPLTVSLGMDIPAGSVITTGATSAELQLNPNSSIIKLTDNTTLSVDSLQSNATGTAAAGSNDFSVKKGKIRAIIARIAGRSDSYTFYSRDTVCGIRGTDFVLDSADMLAVADGAVDFTKNATSETLRVTTGMMANGAAEIFALAELTADARNSLYGNMQFVQLNPLDVPGHEPPPAVEEEPPVEEEKEAEAQEPEGADTPVVAEEPAGEPEKDLTREDRAPGDDPLMMILGGVLAMEVGSFSVDGVTYSKLLFQPTFSIGKLEASLYLPFIYNQNLFDPGDWYKPEGNNEWSFGTDQDNQADMVADIFGDLFLKIRYLKYGRQRDPFYFNFGNYSRVNLGHGILMNNYENNSEFPAIRKVGLNMGFYGSRAALELVGEDLSRPTRQVVGGRFAFSLLGPLAMGISGAADLDPVRDLSPDTDQTTIDKDPLLLNFAIDLELPLVERPVLALVFYADGASLIPSVNGEFQTDFLYDSSKEGVDAFKNYGASAGAMGHVFSLDYRIEYQYADGIFRHGFYNSTYDKMRGERVKEILAYLDSPTDPDPRQGVYGNAGLSLANILYLSGGYSWQWNADGMDLDNDYLQLQLSLEPDVIPVVGIYGSIGYSRTGLARSVSRGSVPLIDDKTTFMGEVVYPVSDYLDIAAVLTSALVRDDEGNIIYDGSGKAEATYAVTLDVRLSY
ncbi:MAG: FecR domain-containing protein [Spirochaetales bacterium]|nr:FecR domain-containing protein [Spirochaetales bacterium]